MKITKKDAELFFELMWALQHFVNLNLKIFPNISGVNEYAKCTAEEKFQVSKALYENKELIDSFVEENPQNFSKEQLSIVSKWKSFIKGKFCVERFLKKYAIFMHDDNVYGVLGLYQGLNELIHPSNLPLYIETVLLPFKGKIIYDGLFQSYNISFGGGIKRTLKESYMVAKQNNRIIESLESTQDGKQINKRNKPVKDWTPELNKLTDIAKNLRSSSECSAIYSPAFSLVKASIEFVMLAVSDLDDLEGLHKSLRKIELALDKSRAALDREER